MTDEDPASAGRGGREASAGRGGREASAGRGGREAAVSRPTPAILVVFISLLGIALLPALDETFVAGVPVSWLLLGLGVYPLAISVAALYVRAAQRNEARYRSLAEPA